ncbi:choice-of-anchor G family protein [Microbacterium sp. GXF0217]
MDGADATDPSAAEAQILSLPAELLGDLELADLGNTITSFPSAPGPEGGGALNLTALEALSVDIGDINLPLLSNGANDGLLQLGDLGAMGSYSSSPNTVTSSASSGLIASGGGIDAGAIDASTDPATLELTNLFDQLDVAGLTDAILDEASVSLGALASEASEESGTVDSAYRIAGLGLDLHSDLVGDLSAGLTSTTNEIVAPINGLVGEDGLVSDVLATLSGVVDTFDLTILGIGVELDSDPAQSTAAITGLDDLVNDVVADLLTQQIANENGSVTVDLSTGTISVDLAELVIGDNGLDPADLENLNALPANTSVLTPDVLSAITAGVTDSLVGTGPDSLGTKLQVALDTRIWNEVGIEIGLDASGQLCVLVCSPLADAEVTITGTLAEFTGKDGATLDNDNIDTTLDLLGLLDLGDLIDVLAPLLIAPITSTVTGPLLDLITDDVLGNVRAIVQTGLVEGTLAPLLGVLSPVISQLVGITINEQPTEPPLNGDGDLGAGSFTVRALSVDLLPLVGGGVSLDLAEASVKALDALAPTVDAQDPVTAGTNLPVTGSGWIPGSTVTLQLTDGADVPVGEPVEVTVGADGTFPVGTVYAIPADAPAGTDYTLTATDPDDNSATDAVEVTAADPGDVNTNAAASASASADATADGDPSAQAAAEAAALADATSAATAAANGDASIAAQAAATADASTAASADSTTDVNAQAAVAAQAAAQADASDDVEAAATATAEANSSVAAQAAATSDSSTDASSEASTNANAAASASASANADATTDAVADVAAQAAAYADATSEATAAADSTAQAAAAAAATATSSATATSDATSAANANAAVAAQAAALADASSDTAAEASSATNANASSAAEAAAIANSSTDASVDATADADPAAAAEVNTNATASAAASAQADADNDAAAQAAAVAAALADASTAADAAATPDAEAAAASAATADATSAASADATTDVNASAAVAAQAAAQADNSASTTADATAAADADAAAAASVAATATSSNDASATAAADADATATATADATADAEVNTNATASAAASAQADADNDAAAQAAAVAAALADASTAADAAATPDAEAAAASAATADATSAASADATTDVNASAAVAAQAAAQADNSSSTAADATAEVDAAAAAEVAATADASNDASATATADATADAEVNTNATASASASAQADSDQNAAAQAAAVAAALADASTAADAAATADAEAAAASAATADATADATVDATSEANAAAAVAAQASAQADNSASAAADTSAAADASANAAAAASASSTATSSASASANAAADSSATADATAAAAATSSASANASADADPAGQLGITVTVPKLERGDQQTAIGTGFTPGEVVTGVMSSEPLALGTQVANADGTVTFTWTIPAGTDLGAHTVTLTGAESGSVAGTFEVVADGLATTGSDVPSGWIALGVLLLMLGLGTALVARSRRAVTAAE